MSTTLALTLMGHVDHGKSSYADSLLASNGLISQRQAGKIRYLDSREDEQERGITIESSGIRLGFKMRRKGDDGQPGPVQDWTLNLIDTPGHIDFSSEVSTSSRLVDGCLILVDALEGVCTQTINVLRQAWIDRLKPILVLNKVDRLAVEVRMTAHEAEAQLQRVIEQANATLAGFWAEERMQEEEKEREAAEAKGEEFTAKVEVDGEEADAELYFDPARGNVIFASSMYGFAFRLHSFSHLYSTKLGLPEEKFRTFLWGDWYFDAKGKRMLNRKQASKLWGEGRLGPTACQQFVIDNLWRVFEKTIIERDQAAIEKIVATLSLPINARDLKTPDSHALLSSILSAWLPLAPCTFSTIVDQIPPPPVAQGRRVPRILDPTGSIWKTDLSRFYADKVGLERPQGRNAVEKDLFSANREKGAWRVGVISKMFAVAKDDLPTDAGKANGNGKDEAEQQRGDVRNLSVEERRRRAREAREKQQAARNGEATLQADREAVQQASTGGAKDTAAVDSVAMPVELSKPTSAEEDQQVPASDLGTAPAVPIEATYERPPTDAPEPAQACKAETSAEDEGSSEVLLAFVRVYSGSLSASTLAASSPFFLLLPKYNPSLGPTHASNTKHIKRIHIQGLYVIMGKELVKVDKVQAGEICAVRGLEGVVGRMGTIVALPETVATPDDESKLISDSAPGFVNLTGGAGLAAPIVRVALEPDNPADMPKLIEGLRLLNQSDPCVQTLVQETGEHVIVTAGELHLERCLKDLRERFAKVPISASKPLVPFRETAIRVGEMAPPRFGEEGEARGTVNVSVANGIVKLKLRAKPLPLAVTELLEANTSTTRSMLEKRGVARGGEEDTSNDVAGAGSSSGTASKVVPASQLFATLTTLLHKAGSSARVWEQEWKEESLVDRIWSFGPRRVGPNLLFGPQEGLAAGRGLKNRLAAKVGAGSGLPTPAVAPKGSDEDTASLTSALAQASLEHNGQENGEASGSATKGLSWSATDLLESLDTGFQIATLQGPLCAEPVRGLAYFIESLTVDSSAAVKANLRLSQVTGSLISSVREACRNGLLDWSPRLMMAMYECDIQAAPDVLGKVHAVLNKRRGKVTSEEMRDGTTYFTIGASLPVVESFGFADEVRKRTSGAASPQLIFRG
jgi:ribosome assembly protein 1